MATREKVQRKLDELEKDGIVEEVTEPTPWISSMVTVVKPSGKLRICLDPKDLNRAVLREKYHPYENSHEFLNSHENLMRFS